MTPCPVCGYGIGRNENYELYTCGGCHVVLHGACYWGRTATIEEWIAYQRRVMETEDEFSPAVICAACRAAEGA